MDFKLIQDDSCTAKSSHLKCTSSMIVFESFWSPKKSSLENSSTNSLNNKHIMCNTHTHIYIYISDSRGPYVLYHIARYKLIIYGNRDIKRQHWHHRLATTWNYPSNVYPVSITMFKSIVGKTYSSLPYQNHIRVHTAYFLPVPPLHPMIFHKWLSHSLHRQIDR